MSWDWGNLQEATVAERNDRDTLGVLKKYHIKGRILEAGCGASSKVYAMHTHGYDVTGLDIDLKIINETKKLFDLNLVCGNVFSLPFKNDYFQAYWSLGIIEHFDDFSGIISEAFRVMKPGGYAFVSFVALNPIKRLKGFLGYKQSGSHYQHTLDRKYVKREFTKYFQILDEYPTAGFLGFTHEIRLLHKLYNYKPSLFVARAFKYLLDKLLSPLFGHTYFLVLKKGRCGCFK